MILQNGQVFRFLQKMEEHKARYGSYPLKLTEIKLDAPKKRHKRIALSKQ